MTKFTIALNPIHKVDKSPFAGVHLINGRTSEIIVTIVMIIACLDKNPEIAGHNNVIPVSVAEVTAVESTLAAKQTAVTKSPMTKNKNFFIIKIFVPEWAVIK